MARTPSGNYTGKAAQIARSEAFAERLDRLCPTRYSQLYDRAKESDPNFKEWYMSHCIMADIDTDEEMRRLEWHICDVEIAEAGQLLRWQMEYELRDEDERDHRSETDFARYGY